jgi:hypothetical protein
MIPRRSAPAAARYLCAHHDVPHVLGPLAGVVDDTPVEWVRRRRVDNPEYVASQHPDRAEQRSRQMNYDSW